jgi:hypothetical protein
VSIESLARRLEARTPGAWEVSEPLSEREPENAAFAVLGPEQVIICTTMGTVDYGLPIEETNREADAELIACAPADLSALLELARAARQSLGRGRRLADGPTACPERRGHQRLLGAGPGRCAPVTASPEQRYASMTEACLYGHCRSCYKGRDLAGGWCQHECHPERRRPTLAEECAELRRVVDAHFGRPLRQFLRRLVRRWENRG